MSGEGTHPASARGATIAVLLGASEFPHHRSLTARVSFARSSQAFKQYLLSADGLGLHADDVLDLFDSAAPVVEQFEQLDAFLRARPGGRTLLVHYVGHGAFVRVGEAQMYYLALRGTRESVELQTGLVTASLAARVRPHAASRAVCMLLDACFAAAAVADFQGAGAGELVRERFDALATEAHTSAARGIAVLAAASKRDAAIAPGDQPMTAFSAALMDTLAHGAAGAGPRLSLQDVCDLVVDRLRASDDELIARPEVHTPRQSAGDVARLGLFPNHGWRASSERPARVPTTPSDTPRVERVERVERSGPATHGVPTHLWVAALAALVALIAGTVGLVAYRAAHRARPVVVVPDTLADVAAVDAAVHARDVVASPRVDVPSVPPTPRVVTVGLRFGRSADDRATVVYLDVGNATDAGVQSYSLGQVAANCAREQSPPAPALLMARCTEANAGWVTVYSVERVGVRLTTSARRYDPGSSPDGLGGTTRPGPSVVLPADATVRSLDGAPERRCDVRTVRAARGASQPPDTQDPAAVCRRTVRTDGSFDRSGAGVDVTSTAPDEPLRWTVGHGTPVARCECQARP